MDFLGPVFRFGKRVDDWIFRVFSELPIRRNIARSNSFDEEERRTGVFSLAIRTHDSRVRSALCRTVLEEPIDDIRANAACWLGRVVADAEADSKEAVDTLLEAAKREPPYATDRLFVLKGLAGAVATNPEVEALFLSILHNEGEGDFAVMCRMAVLDGLEPIADRDQVRSSLETLLRVSYPYMAASLKERTEDILEGL